jgi:hypothetical protein
VGFGNVMLERPPRFIPKFNHFQMLHKVPSARTNVCLNS